MRVFSFEILVFSLETLVVSADFLKFSFVTRVFSPDTLVFSALTLANSLVFLVFSLASHSVCLLLIFVSREITVCAVCSAVVINFVKALNSSLATILSSPYTLGFIIILNIYLLLRVV